jgi:hypothetical protein
MRARTLASSRYGTGRMHVTIAYTLTTAEPTISFQLSQL